MRSLVVALLGIVAGCSGPALTSGLADAVASAEEGAVLRISPGRYQGPIIIDRPMTVLGGDGVVIMAPPGGIGIEIRHTSQVDVSAVTVEGGTVGVRVWRSDDVGLSTVTVRGSERHGILVENASAIINGCHVEDLAGRYARGIEVKNSELHLASEVSGCTVVGPVHEGIASRLSHVVFRDNRVQGAAESGIAVTEMSSGSVEDSIVDGGSGVGILCGDMSSCHIVDNQVSRLVPGDQRLSTGGNGVVVQYHSVAVVQGLETRDLAGDPLVTSLGGVVSEG